MGVEAVVSIAIAAAASAGAIYSTIFQRKELKGKTRAEQDAISIKASNEALAIIQGGLGKELERVAADLEDVRTECRTLRVQLEDNAKTLHEVSAHRDRVVRENADLHREVAELRRRVAELEAR